MQLKAKTKDVNIVNYWFVLKHFEVGRTIFLREIIISRF